jgi:hypothetical protein
VSGEAPPWLARTQKAKHIFYCLLFPDITSINAVTVEDFVKDVPGKEIRINSNNGLWWWLNHEGLYISGTKISSDSIDLTKNGLLFIPNPQDPAYFIPIEGDPTFFINPSEIF